MDLEFKHIKIVKKETSNSKPLKTILDLTKSAERLLWEYQGTSIEDIISPKDLEKVTNFDFFMTNSNIAGVLELNIPSATNLSFAFNSMKNLEELHLSNTNNVSNYDSAFDTCVKLNTITGVDFSNATSVRNMFRDNLKLTNLSIKNIKINIQLGASSSWGHLLTLDSLINSCKECINVGETRTLTIGTTNIEKLSNTYVRLTGKPEEDETNPKLPCEVCNSTASDAILISDYMALKNWTLA